MVAREHRDTRQPAPLQVDFKGKKVEARRIAEDEAAKSAIYIGKKKLAADDSEPRFLMDDERKYPSRDKLNMAGGFAGGERGVQQFVEKGDLEIAEEGALLSWHTVPPVSALTCWPGAGWWPAATCRLDRLELRMAFCTIC